MRKKKINDQVKDMILTDEETVKMKSLVRALSISGVSFGGSLMIASLIALIGLVTSIHIIMLVLASLLYLLSFISLIYSRKKAKEVQVLLKTIETRNQMNP